MSSLKIGALYIHPVKGGTACAVETAQIKKRGPADDRRWLVTDDRGVFLSQRNCAGLARLMATPVSGGLRLEMDGRGAVDAARPEKDGVRTEVTVWQDKVAALSAGAVTDRWLSSALGRAARLYYMDGLAVRTTSGRWGPQVPVSFADGYPLLVTTAASLEALNDELSRQGGAAVGMERFRPNIVISGGEAWAEDCWRTLRLGDALIDLVKPCVRCVVTTTDQQTGVRMGREPLATLARIRRSAHQNLTGALFGWNATVRKEGKVALGDGVEIIEKDDRGWPLKRP